MSTFLIITILIVAGWYFFFRRRNSRSDLITQVEVASTRVKIKLGLSHLKEYLGTEKLFFETTGRNYLRLKERYKHDENKLNQIMQDWKDYLDALSEIIYARELLDVDMEEGASDRFDERVKEEHIEREEIEKRFKELLGKEYQDPQKQTRR